MVRRCRTRHCWCTSALETPLTRAALKCLLSFRPRAIFERLTTKSALYSLSLTMFCFPVAGHAASLSVVLSSPATVGAAYTEDSGFNRGSFAAAISDALLPVSLSVMADFIGSTQRMIRHGLEWEEYTGAPVSKLHRRTTGAHTHSSTQNVVLPTVVSPLFSSSSLSLSLSHSWLGSAHRTVACIVRDYSSSRHLSLFTLGLCLSRTAGRFSQVLARARGGGDALLIIGRAILTIHSVLLSRAMDCRRY